MTGWRGRQTRAWRENAAEQLLLLVRIIQRFGRIDRIGSPNERIQLVNFWRNREPEEYINLEQRLSGRMVLVDISATGEENAIEQQSGNPMNDLVYRRSSPSSSRTR
jgi:hypothetical protein